MPAEERAERMGGMREAVRDNNVCRRVVHIINEMRRLA
jgi:hypothetical protein